MQHSLHWWLARVSSAVHVAYDSNRVVLPVKFYHWCDLVVVASVYFLCRCFRRDFGAFLLCSIRRLQVFFWFSNVRWVRTSTWRNNPNESKHPINGHKSWLKESTNKISLVNGKWRGIACRRSLCIIFPLKTRLPVSGATTTIGATLQLWSPCKLSLLLVSPYRRMLFQPNRLAHMPAATDGICLHSAVELDSGCCSWHKGRKKKGWPPIISALNCWSR